MKSILSPTKDLYLKVAYAEKPNWVPYHARDWVACDDDYTKIQPVHLSHLVIIS